MPGFYEPGHFGIRIYMNQFTGLVTNDPTALVKSIPFKNLFLRNLVLPFSLLPTCSFQIATPSLFRIAIQRDIDNCFAINYNFL